MDANGSEACTTNPATNIVSINGIVAILVLKPMITSMGAINSAKVARIKVGVAPIPTGSIKAISPEMTFMNLPYPWPQIIAPLMPIRNKSNPISLIIVVNECFFRRAKIQNKYLMYFCKIKFINMSKISAWISAARLRTLPLSVAGIIVGSAAAIAVRQFSLIIFILALLTTLGLQILSNFANDYGDGIKGTDNEDRVGPVRAMQGGLLSEKELKKGMLITAILTLLLACILIYFAFRGQHFGISILFFILGVSAIAAAIKYTVGKSAYGYKAMGDLFVFLFFGLLSVIGGYYLYSYSVGELIILPAITVGLLSTAVLNINNMRDQNSDKKVNKNTLAVLLGPDNVKIYHYCLILVAFSTAGIYALMHWEYTNFFGLLPLIAFMPLFKNLKVVAKNKIPARLDPELKKIALSTFAYAILFFIVQILI